MTDPVQRKQLSDVQRKLQEGLPSIDDHHRLVGRPVTYRLISGQAVEIVFTEVPSIDESTVLGIKRLIGDECFCSVTPHTAETLTVRFVVPVTRR